MELQAMAETLRKVPMFSRLEASKLKLVAFTSELQIFDDGEELFHQGDGSDSAYVVMDGLLEIVVHSAGEDVIAAILRRNELVGELGVLTNSVRASTIRAQGEVKVLKIDADLFLEMLSDNPTLSLDVMRQLSEKVVRTHEMYERTHKELEQALSRLAEVSGGAAS